MALGAFLAVALFGSMSDALARDITLGGNREEKRQSDNQFTAKLPDDALALPRLVATVQNHETGRWQRVLVEAYLQSSDRRTLGQVRDHLREIADRAGPQLEARPAEDLAAARNGPREAKTCIRLAAEESLGHSWAGNIYIRSLAVF
jgi:hypothetical protein